MKALRLHGAGDLRLHEEPLPEPGADELLLRVTAVGLCGSDRHWFVEGGIGDAALARPLVLGHEFVATVEAGPRAGERVALDPAIPCGRCTTCLSGRQHLCLKLRFAGHGSTDGALRSFMAWPERLAHRLPDSLSEPEGALLEPLGVAVHALELAHVGAGMSAAVFGCGPIGLLLVQALRAFGAPRIFAADPLPHRAAAAAELGATHLLAPGEAQAVAVKVAFEVAGEDSALGDALEAVAPGGRIVLVGIPDGDRTCFTASTARRKGLTLLLSRRMGPADLPRAIGQVEEGRVELGPLVTARYALTQAQAAFADLVERRGLKTIIEPQRTNGSAR